MDKFLEEKVDGIEGQNLEKLKSELHDDLKQSLNSPENHLSIEEFDALLEDTLNKYGV